MKFNRSDLLTQVRKGGYTGEADPAKVKSFLAGLGMDSENIEVPGDDGKPTSAKFDDVWAKTATLALPSQELDAEPEATEGDEPEVEVKAAKKDAPRPGFGFKAGGLSRMIEGGDGKPGFAIRSERERNVKAYNRRVAMKSELPFEKRPVFDDGDEAESFTSFMRLAMTGGGRLGYKMRRHDEEVCTKAQVNFDNGLGGITVPTYWSNKLIWLTEQCGVAMKLASVEHMTSDKGIYPRKTSIAAMSPSAEGDTKGQTDLTTDGVALSCREASNIYLASYQWFEDSNVSAGDVTGARLGDSPRAARRRWSSTPACAT